MHDEELIAVPERVILRKGSAFTEIYPPPRGADVILADYKD